MQVLRSEESHRHLHHAADYSVRPQQDALRYRVHFVIHSVVLNKGDVSSNSLFMRFTTAKKTFTEKELDYFSRMDYKQHNGVGIILDKPGYPGVGTARYFVDPNDPTTAEWSVIVVDKFHGQGIGVLLFYTICVVQGQCKGFTTSLLR